MYLLNLLSRRIESLNEAVGRGVSWLTTILVVLFCADVTMRYVFNISYAAVFDLEWHLFAVIFLLGAGYTLKHNKHVRVDVLYGRLGKKQQAWINLLGVLIFLFPLCFVVIKTSVLFVYNSWIIGEGSPDPGGLPGRYIIKAMIPLGFFFLLLQGLSLAIRSMLTILKPAEDDE